MQISRKRRHEHEEADQKFKTPRTSFGGQHEIEKALDEYAKVSRSPSYHDIKNDNIVSSLSNTIKSITTDTFNKSGDKVNLKPSFPTTFTATSPFTYQPLEEYLKAEALRLLFIRNGLHYKEPRADIRLFGEDNLTPYIEHWQECFSHWYPLMGSNSMAKSVNHEHNKFDDCMSPVFGQNHAKEANSFNSESNKPEFRPTVANWGLGLSTKEQVRQIVQTEVRKQLDDLETRTSQSESTCVDIPSYSHEFLDQTDSVCSRDRLLDAHRSGGHSLPSSRNLDDSNELPETDSINWTNDDGSTLLGDNDENTQDVSE